MTKLSDRIMRRKGRVRGELRAAAGTRKRLSVHRSSKHIYAQVIDDENGVTVASASSIEKDQRAQQKGVKDVIFDRGSYLYHGRVKALADAAREGGLNF